MNFQPTASVRASGTADELRTKADVYSPPERTARYGQASDSDSSKPNIANAFHFSVG